MKTTVALCYLQSNMSRKGAVLGSRVYTYSVYKIKLDLVYIEIGLQF